MFYPVNSLKKGGRFYLCWVADSWPKQFKKLTSRNEQLRVQDIREICDHLREVMNTESGRPSHRFSLRLSSQLMRGLARLYQKKVDIFIRDVLNITMIARNPRSREYAHMQAVTPRRRQTNREKPRLVIEELPPDDENLDRIQENTNNIVRVEDITLKEPTLPEIRLIEDGFGELNQDPVEMMLGQEVSALQLSALELPHDFSADKSHDKSRLAPHDTVLMERISEHDMSLFRKSAVEAPTLTDFEKDIPEISDIPQPELLASEPQKKANGQLQEEAEIVELPMDLPTEPAARNETQEIILEDLEDEPQRKTRRVRNKLILDRTIKLSKEIMRARLADHTVERRCESSFQDRMVIRTPAAVLLGRPTHCGHAPASKLGRPLAAMFANSLANVEEALHQRSARQEQFDKSLQQRKTPDKTIQDKTIQEPDVPIDLADLPTQKVQSLSPVKRTSQLEKSPKRRRSQRSSALQMSATEANKENIPGAENIPVAEYTVEANIENIPGAETIPVAEYGKHDVSPIGFPPDESAQVYERRLTSLLEAKGLTDAQERTSQVEPATLTQRKKTKGSEGSESERLGSLDRTPVSLGYSEKTTDSKKFIDDHWGVKGTMLKIFRCVVKGTESITVESLLRRGPVVDGRRPFIAAKCFTSILKLHSHQFIKIIKKKNSNEIQHIELGSAITKRLTLT